MNFHNQSNLSSSTSNQSIFFLSHLSPKNSLIKQLKNEKIINDFVPIDLNYTKINKINLKTNKTEHNEFKDEKICDFPFGVYFDSNVELKNFSNPNKKYFFKKNMNPLLSLRNYNHDFNNEYLNISKNSILPKYLEQEIIKSEVKKFKYFQKTIKLKDSIERNKEIIRHSPSNKIIKKKLNLNITNLDDSISSISAKNINKNNNKFIKHMKNSLKKSKNSSLEASSFNFNGLAIPFFPHNIDLTQSKKITLKKYVKNKNFLPEINIHHYQKNIDVDSPIQAKKIEVKFRCF